MLAAIIGAACVVSAAGAVAAPLPDGDNDFNSPGFVVRHAWVKFASVAMRPFRDGLSREEEDARVARFFELNALIAAEERAAGDASSAPEGAARARTAAAAHRDERAGIENSVERIVEGRLTAAAREAGLTRHFGGDIVWPPVAIEFEEPPSVLVTSPRAEIRKEHEKLLEGQLPIERVEAIEARAERDGETSALVVNISAIAMYPAIIPASTDYAQAMEQAAHEWMHHYLFFAPLGRRYYESSDLRTLNETVANMAGREMGAMIVARYPVAARQATTSAPVTAQAGGIDFTVEMRTLRRQVEALLREGRVAEAERRMAEKRRFLAERGYYIRRLNQAYFAFHGSYADTPASIDPIGPQLDELRRRSVTLEAFIETARGLRSRADLDALVAPVRQ